MKSLLKKTVTECSKVSNSANRAAAVQRSIEIIEPFSSDFIEYEKGMNQGTVWHQDCFAVFGTAIYIL